jgi:DNA (cytosine-5)-methyltransferase 1
LTQGLGSGGPDLAHALAGWLIGLKTSDIDGATWVVNAAQAVSENQRGELLLTDYSHQLTTGGGKPGQGYPAVFTFAMQPDDRGTHAGALRIVPTDVAPTIAATDGVKSTDRGLRVATSTIVRRLTPVECERLMGWPDDHTRWRADGTEVADSHRYRMCGNGVAAVVAQWLGERISEVQR